MEFEGIPEGESSYSPSLRASKATRLPWERAELLGLLESERNYWASLRTSGIRGPPEREQLLGLPKNKQSYWVPLIASKATGPLWERAELLDFTNCIPLPKGIR